ncbi:hypothetical protein PNEG_00532 [Pneumocystis murina B123]|uniref:Uncharacterized protein n=1 Tax=Pneumocystis murina (strain B123) TaxID=1069680 RepID=M7NWJ1_PNEMU|nr:hypothetical protein PNEG_00532 [Pneumocystis murina B123]EMR11521.1 hypothetical protein PNEG_00532 [Pneumocystis murina B123]
MSSSTNKQSSKNIYSHLRRIPLELYPLAAVLLVGFGAATYQLGNKLFFDPSLRRYPSKKSEH